MKKQFFDIVRKELFSNILNQSQVEGLEFILDYFNGQTDITDIRQFAYILGTIHHETGATMQPIEEWGKGKGKLYGTNVKMNKRPYYDTKKIFYGRGYVQLTWYENYLVMTKLAKLEGHNWDFINNPELMLQHEPSIWVCFKGMSQGLFTGKKLSDYIFGKEPDFINARRIINGLDCSEKIAKLCTIYYKALTQ